MAKKIKYQDAEIDDVSFAPGVGFARKAIWWWLPLLYLLVSDTFYLRTYDSAQVKITLLQMGGFSLLGMWVSLLILEGRKAFRRDDFIMLAPFFAYMAYVIMSFLHTPYRGPSVDDFVRYTLYMSVTLIIIREFTAEAMDRLTKILLITAYISVLYGFVQFLDTRFFPPKDVGPGLDPFIWRWAFWQRVFSTYGNPNFFGNFLVLILPIAVTQFLKRKSVLLLPLIFLNLLCLYATETKGAWLGFGISFFIFSVFYGYFFLRERLQMSKVKFLGLASIVPLGAFIAVLAFAYMRPQSVGFRVATWLSTFEMISSRPLTGLGVGCFKVIYPAYRRPVIFHIEGKHNTETDHAEEEHLEQVMDNGIVGGGLYFWIIAFVTVVGLRALSALTDNLKGARPPPVAYDILGYLTAFLGMLAHNMTDVSMRFVSSGIFLGLLPGVILNLSRGRALWELHYKEEAAAQDGEQGPSPLFTAAMWAVRLAAIGGVIYTSLLILRQFSDLQGGINMYTAKGEVLQWYISWGVMLACVLGGLYAYGGIILKGVSIAAPVVLLASMFPIYYFWGWFKGDVYHNMAIFFSKQGKWEDAISYYQKVNKLNEFFIMPYYFTGNVFNDRFNMEKTYRPDWGDKNSEGRTDFERAMAAYEKVRSMAPNYVQMHHQVGLLYMKMHDYYLRQNKPEEANKYLDMALARFNLYEKLDPVYDLNYYRKAQIYVMRGDLAAAEREYQHNLYGWKCYVKGHLHETPEAYFNLANVQYGLKKFGEAAESYRQALKLNPDHAAAKRNLAIAEAQLQAQGRGPVPAQAQRR